MNIKIDIKPNSIEILRTAVSGSRPKLMAIEDGMIKVFEMLYKLGP